VLTRFAFIALLAVPLGGLHAAADDPEEPTSGSVPLFASDEVLALALSVDFDALCRPNEVEDCDYTPTTLRYADEDGEERGIPVVVRVRGGWRARKDHCDVPPLFIRFSAEGIEGTPFAGQELVPLTTHCRNSRARKGTASGDAYEQYVLKEYLAYRLYNMVNDKSLRVRVVRIAYSNPAKPGKSRERYAFFTEHFDDMAARNAANWSSSKSYDQEKVDLVTWDQVALFNFMIGNTDWSVVRERNLLLIAGEDSFQYPVPYDFDMSGLVDAEYSGVSPRLDFRNPRKRYYLGFCHPQVNFQARFAEFKQHKDAMLGMVGEVPGISWKTAKTSRSYLDKFFDVLESAKKGQKMIVDACHPWPPSPEDHTTPPDPA